MHSTDFENKKKKEQTKEQKRIKQTMLLVVHGHSELLGRSVQLGTMWSQPADTATVDPHSWFYQLALFPQCSGNKQT